MKLALACLVGALSGTSAYGQLTIPWYTIDGGGGETTAGGFTLKGTIGQHDAGASLWKNGFECQGGYWQTGEGRFCPADVDDGTGTGTPDGGVTIDDLVFFILLLENGDIRADLDDDGAEPQHPDGGVTIDDLIYFITRFTAGC